MVYNPYTHQLFFIVKKSRKQDIIDWIDNHPEAAAKLGLGDVIANEVVKITTTPPPNSGATVQVLGVASFITKAQRDFWVSIKDKVPVDLEDDIEGTIRRTDNMLDFDVWLAGQSTPLYRIQEDA
jgi:hypothetical protein